MMVVVPESRFQRMMFIYVFVAFVIFAAVGLVYTFGMSRDGHWTILLLATAAGALAGIGSVHEKLHIFARIAVGVMLFGPLFLMLPGDLYAEVAMAFLLSLIVAVSVTCLLAFARRLFSHNEVSDRP